MSLASIQMQTFIFYCSPVQVEWQVPVPVFTSSIKWLDINVYKSLWTPLTDKTCKCIMWEDNNEHNEYTAIFFMTRDR